MNTDDLHLGVDIEVAEGSQVCATDAGIVDEMAWDDDFGWYMVIYHGKGYKTIFGHLQKFIAENGSLVGRGQIIAISGNTGFTKTPCLHFAIMEQNRYMNPKSYLASLRTLN